jgi:dephospho-CoA kinase
MLKSSLARTVDRAKLGCMLKVGLTGGIASGKTTVLGMFALHGAHTLRADGVAHDLMMPGEPVFERIVAAFGREILADDGTIARPRLAAAAFPSRIGELNAIVHPAVLTFEDEWLHRMGERDPEGVAICEAALLIEAGGRARFNRLIVVTCTDEQKIARYAARTLMSDEAAAIEVRRRMAAQMPEEEKAKLADYVVDNSGSRDHAERQVAEIWLKLKAEARKTS